MDQHQRFTVEIVDDVTVVHLRDPALYDMILISELHDELLVFIERYLPRKLLVDFGRVTICSSAVVNSLLLARKRLNSYNAIMRLCNMERPVRDAFAIMRLDGTLFQIDNSLSDSLEAVA